MEHRLHGLPTGSPSWIHDGDVSWTSRLSWRRGVTGRSSERCVPYRQAPVLKQLGKLKGHARLLIDVRLGHDLVGRIKDVRWPLDGFRSCHGRHGTDDNGNTLQSAHLFQACERPRGCCSCRRALVQATSNVCSSFGRCVANEALKLSSQQGSRTAVMNLARAAET
jgi:hypothetical protein